MDHYADDLAAMTAHLDLKDAIHVGHSTGGGEVVRYLGRHGESRVAKAAIISAMPPLMVKSAANPNGLPKWCLTTCRGNLLPSALSSITICQLDRSTVTTGRARKVSAVIWNWWRQSMMGGAKAHYDGIVAFSQTDFTEDLKKIDSPRAGDAWRRRSDRSV